MVTRAEHEQRMERDQDRLERARRRALDASAKANDAKREALEEGLPLMGTIMSVYARWRARFRRLRRVLPKKARKVGEACLALEEAVEFKLWQIRAMRLLVMLRGVVEVPMFVFLVIGVLMFLILEVRFPGMLDAVLNSLAREWRRW